MEEEKKVESEKRFSVKILFDKPESNIFGGLSNTSMVLDVSESVKDKLLEEFQSQDSVVSVKLSADGKSVVRHVNCRNILYMDIVEIAEVEEAK